MAKRAGPALIEIGEGASKITLTNDDQLNDAVIMIERDEFQLKSQISSKPVGYIKVGIEPKLEVSVAEVTAAQISLLFGTPLITSTDTVNSVNYTMTKTEVTDQAGQLITGQKVVIKPYPIVADPGTTAPTTATYNGKTYASVQAAEDAFDNDVSLYKAWLNQLIEFPNGALTSVNGSRLAFGLQTQQELKLTITGLPGVGGVRMVYGDNSV
jgi:hypothetical protein